MDITSLSTSLSQQSVQQSASLQVQKMAMDGAKEQGADLARMMESTRAITDPALGSRVDILA
ncbi:MAG: YjfB family protein [Spirochaetales bacterium]|nr:YjfB family protein [Spirochaetales bacterium]